MIQVLCAFSFVLISEGVRDSSLHGDDAIMVLRSRGDLCTLIAYWYAATSLSNSYELSFFHVC